MFGPLMGFGSTFGHLEIIEWQNIHQLLDDVRPSSGRDEVSWRLDPFGEFTTGSLYKEILRTGPTIDLSGIWKAKIPAKIKNFLWKTVRNQIPSGDQVRK